MGSFIAWIAGLFNKRILGTVGALFAPVFAQGYDLIKDNYQSQTAANVFVVLLGLLYASGFWMATRPEAYNRKLIETCLRVFLDVIGFSKMEDVRCVMWIPRPGRSELFPACDYVPSEEPVKFTSLHESVGIVGLAYRSRKPEFEHITEPAESRKEHQEWMVKEWGFTMDQAKRTREDRTFYAAVPVVTSAGKVLGVIYFDCKGEVNFEDADRVQREAPKVAVFLEHILKKEV